MAKTKKPRKKRGPSIKWSLNYEKIFSKMTKKKKKKPKYIIRSYKEI